MLLYAHLPSEPVIGLNISHPHGVGDDGDHDHEDYGDDVEGDYDVDYQDNDYDDASINAHWPPEPVVGLT